jgi:hypothetical protein
MWGKNIRLISIMSSQAIEILLRVINRGGLGSDL